MDKFNEKYRDDYLRLLKWDYGWAAAYFVTICTREKECFFGEVMELSPVGVIAVVLRYEIKNHAKIVGTRFIRKVGMMRNEM